MPVCETCIREINQQQQITKMRSSVTTIAQPNREIAYEDSDMVSQHREQEITQDHFSGLVQLLILSSWRKLKS
ncbi:MAG: hypothetical protein OFPI_43750 [Osedax symbiont Rs2]|nr:MAG: hypothetical protein OFPI_43750 [Osedax symbiont Rs2]